MSRSTSSNGDHAATPRATRIRANSVAVRMGLVPDPPGDDLYHGFISYSHAADGKLAPALQKGLQQFAKPWYRTRALHIFRDEAALSADPGLWSAVRAALDSSQYFILLASPQAARSPWVTREVSDWREHKQPERILIGLTDGELPFSCQNAKWRGLGTWPARPTRSSQTVAKRRSTHWMGWWRRSIIRTNCSPRGGR
jgi:hypothetical protein